MTVNTLSYRRLLLTLLGMLAWAAAEARSEGSEDERKYQALFAGYDMYSLHPADAASFTLNGFAVGYNIDFKVSKSLPLYLGTGLDFRFAFRVKTFHESPTYNPIDAKTTTHFINLNLPVNLSYRVDATPSTAIIPQFGFDFRVQLSARSKVEVSAPAGSPEMTKAALGYSSGNYNLLSGRQMGTEVMRRCQVGWHAGLKLQHGAFMIGVSYGTDFARLRNELGASNLMVNLGYVF